MLLYALCGVALAAGLVALVAGLIGTVDAERPQPGPLATRAHILWYGAPGTPTRRVLRLRRIQLALTLVGAPAAWLFTRVPVTVAVVPLGVFGLPWLFAATRSDTRHIVRLEALGEWTQRLGDVLLLGVGLNQALVTSRRTAPVALEQEIGSWPTACCPAGGPRTRCVPSATPSRTPPRTRCWPRWCCAPATAVRVWPGRWRTWPSRSVTRCASGG